MKKMLICIIGGMFIWAAASFYVNNNTDIILSRKNIINLESSSTRMYYTIYLFGFLPVGKAMFADRELAEYKGLSLYKLSAEAHGSNFVNKFYPFFARIDSYIDRINFLPIFFEQTMKINKQKSVKEISYDQKNNIMRILEERRSILSETYDPLSAIYKLRRSDLDILTDFDLNINTNQKNYVFIGKVKPGNARDLRIYEIKGKIFRRDKNPYHQSKVDIVLAGSKVKIPVLIKVFASGAYLTIKLNKVE